MCMHALHAVRRCVSMPDCLCAAWTDSRLFGHTAASAACRELRTVNLGCRDFVLHEPLNWTPPLEPDPALKFLLSETPPRHWFIYTHTGNQFVLEAVILVDKHLGGTLEFCWHVVLKRLKVELEFYLSAERTGCPGFHSRQQYDSSFYVDSIHEVFQRKAALKHNVCPLCLTAVKNISR